MRLRRLNMSKRLMLSKLMILVLALMSLPVTQLQTSAAEGPNTKISFYSQDPFVEESAIGRMDASRFDPDASGRLLLSGEDRKSTRLNSSHGYISYAVFC